MLVISILQKHFKTFWCSPHDALCPTKHKKVELISWQVALVQQNITKVELISWQVDLMRVDLVTPSPLFVVSFAGHFDNTIVPYWQPLKLHFKNMMVRYQLPLDLATMRNVAVRHPRIQMYFQIFYNSDIVIQHLQNDIRIHTYIHTCCVFDVSFLYIVQ